ncbi:HAD-IIIA family hydrolase [Halovulum dunhuangense]|uniref:D,D-heptose 1,7-bisphosphate phosphatase n=1 Tax=Halovulum dunhuangense TaxID=1505036 RepID=A0A849L264_9RHOB|nr:HAD-IIIA family hydrolase [Halovulum dunhuangense]NNU80311.1 HAD-IIIA family hydrolase [Halovulum dunhuangense]
MRPTPPRQAVILAGGRGTRLQPLTLTRPKPMVVFHGKPFLEYIVEMLRDQGIERILMLLGYLPGVITDHFGDGSRLGVSIEYDITDPDDLTAHRVLHAADRIDETFLLLYCDNYWPMRLDDMWARFVASGADGQVTVYANEDRFSKDSVIVGPDGFVDVFDRTRTTPGLKGIEISYAILRKSAVLPLLPTDRQELFEQAVYPALARAHRLGAYWSGHRYYSVGNLDRLPVTDEFLARRPAILLDRDGVLNARAPRAEYVRRAQDLRPLPGAAQAVGRLTRAGYRVIVVSNQAGIGRGVMTEADLAAVNDRLRAEVAQAGGRIDAIYHCPHDWDAGCACRKPAPGMLFQAQRDWHLDLTRTLFVGDDPRDAEAARAAGCPFQMVGPGRSLADIVDRALGAPLQETGT